MHVSHQDNTAFIIDVAVPGDNRLTQKINEKREKYTNLKIELQRMWNMCAVVVPIVIRSLGSIPVCLAVSLNSLNIESSMGKVSCVQKRC